MSGSKRKARRWWTGRTGWLLVCGVVLVLGIVLGAAGSHLFGTGPVTPAPVATAAKAPPPDLSPDPPATETARRTVIEEEPVPPPEAAGRQTAMVLPPERNGAAPTARWRSFAVPAPDARGRPMVAVIIDDMGVDKRRSERILQLPGPLTVSFLPYSDDVAHLAGEARAQGDELMVHLPMEPLAANVDPGPDALRVALPADELHRRLVANLDRFGGYVGVNNHMGSKFTANPGDMRLVMEELHRRGLLFVDSLTTDRSVGLAEARQAGVPAVARNVFLDNVGEVPAVEAQLAKLEALARRKGSAIAIGHPRDATIAALAAWLPTVERKGLVLVPVSAVVAARLEGEGPQLAH